MKIQVINAQLTIQNLSAGFASNNLQTANLNQIMQQATAIRTPISAEVPDLMFPLGHGEEACIRQHHYDKYNLIQTNSAPSFTSASSSLAHLNAGFASNKLQEPNINLTMLLATTIRTPMSAGVADPTFCLGLEEDANIRQQQYKIIQANSAPRFTSVSSTARTFLPADTCAMEFPDISPPSNNALGVCQKNNIQPIQINLETSQPNLKTQVSQSVKRYASEYGIVLPQNASTFAISSANSTSTHNEQAAKRMRMV